MGKDFEGVYFPMGEFLSATKGSRVSWGWSSLLAGRDIIRREGMWRIGDGSSILIHKDPWIHTETGYGT